MGGIGGVLAVELQPKHGDNARIAGTIRTLLAEGARRGASTISLKALSDLLEK